MKVIFENKSLVTFNHIKNVLSNDDLRPAMQGVNINLKEKRLEATDAHVCMVYPIAISEDSVFDKDSDSLIVPARFFNHLKYMEEIPKKYLDTLQYVLTDEFAEVYFANELVYRCRYIDAKFPKIQAVLPNEEWKREKVESIGFSINVLEKMLKAFPRSFPNNLKFTLYSANKGVLVESTNEDCEGVFGMVMPILLNFNNEPK